MLPGGNGAPPVARHARPTCPPQLRLTAFSPPPQSRTAPSGPPPVFLRDVAHFCTCCHNPCVDLHSPPVLIRPCPSPDAVQVFFQVETFMWVRQLPAIQMLCYFNSIMGYLSTIICFPVFTVVPIVSVYTKVTMGLEGGAVSLSISGGNSLNGTRQRSGVRLSSAAGLVTRAQYNEAPSFAEIPLLCPRHHSSSLRTHRQSSARPGPRGRNRPIPPVPLPHPHAPCEGADPP